MTDILAWISANEGALNWVVTALALIGSGIAAWLSHTRQKEIVRLKGEIELWTKDRRYYQNDRNEAIKGTENEAQMVLSELKAALERPEKELDRYVDDVIGDVIIRAHDLAPSIVEFYPRLPANMGQKCRAIEASLKAVARGTHEEQIEAIRGEINELLDLTREFREAQLSKKP